MQIRNSPQFILCFCSNLELNEEILLS